MYSVFVYLLFHLCKRIVMASVELTTSSASVPLEKESEKSNKSTCSNDKIILIASGVLLLATACLSEDSKLSTPLSAFSIALAISILVKMKFQKSSVPSLKTEEDLKVGENPSKKVLSIDRWHLSKIKPPQEEEYEKILSYMEGQMGAFYPKKKDLLSDVEQLALHLWTTEFYPEMNKVADGTEDNDQIARINEIAIYALSRLPVVENQNNLTRTASFTIPEIQAKFIPGAIYSSRRFMSTHGKDQALPKGGNVRFFVIGKTGRNIKAYSQNPKEEEVLFSPGANFLVGEVKNVSQGLLNRWEIQLTEV